LDVAQTLLNFALCDLRVMLSFIERSFGFAVAVVIPSGGLFTGVLA